jgi:hypothetical protein
MNQLTIFAKAVALWAVLLMSAGCAGITPYDAPDYREEPLGDGLLTGKEGEFVILSKEDKPETGSEAGKGSDETADSEIKQMNSEKQNPKIKNGGQKP